jgi:diketogulonate reductase-like aldo/keto reductase
MASSSVLGKLVLEAAHLKTARGLPAFIYGTAWKKEQTADLVYQALCNGYTGIDTAAQPKHYREDLVAGGIRRAIEHNVIKRSDLYLQTKFTSVGGQDPNHLPYDAQAPLTDQVNASVISSLQNFTFNAPTPTGTNSVEQPYIDTIVLHSPMQSATETLEVWRTLEQYVPGEIRHLGISNCTLFELMDLYERATIKPSVVQNRFYARTKYDIGLRRFCEQKGILYQAFWTLSANPGLARSPVVTRLAKELDCSVQSALYCLVLGLPNVVVLNGTTSSDHMLEDWQAVSSARALAEKDSHAWNQYMANFRQLIGEIKS